MCEWWVATHSTSHLFCFQNERVGRRKFGNIISRMAMRWFIGNSALFSNRPCFPQATTIRFYDRRRHNAVQFVANGQRLDGRIHRKSRHRRRKISSRFLNEQKPFVFFFRIIFCSNRVRHVASTMAIFPREKSFARN